MAKGQRRSNREAKKPKQTKAQPGGAVSVASAAMPAGRDQPGPRKGRK
jgi:hypothetical protein